MSDSDADSDLALPPRERTHKFKKLAEQLTEVRRIPAAAPARHHLPELPAAIP